MREDYIHQVELLLDVLPIVMKDSRLALKGGTAINFFYRDAPRLSIDIDLCYLPIEDRKTSFQNIHDILKEIKFSLERLNFKVMKDRCKTACFNHRSYKLVVIIKASMSSTCFCTF